jgi:hypothetical protein
MKILSMISIAISLTACQQKKPEVAIQHNEYALKVSEKIGNEKVMCAQDLCVTEEEIYQERGPLIYAIDDKLHYQKYEMSKTILLQKIIEKKLAATGENFSAYHKKIRSSTNVSDEEVFALLNKFKLNNISKDSEQFAELRNKLLNDKVQEKYLKTLTSAGENNEIFVKIPRKQRKKIELPYDKLVSYKTEKDPELKITIAFNPSARDLKNLFQIIESSSGFLASAGEKVSWYFLPYSDEKEASVAYGKLLLCSISLDQGASYKEALEVSRTFDSEKQIFEYLGSRSRKIEPLQKCFSNEGTLKQIASLRDLSKDSGLMNTTQVIYNNEIESQIPGLVEFKDRIVTKLKTKTLVKN